MTNPTFTLSRRMAHNIIGSEVDASSAAEAMHQAGLDWTVSLEDIQTSSGIEIPSKFATIKTHLKEDGVHQSVLGVVGSRYQVVQNAEIFSALDSLVDSGDAKYVSAGQLEGGAVVWTLMELPKEVSIAGDPHAAYLLARTSHDGSSSLQVAPTVVRLRCTNQINPTLRGSQIKYTLRHSRGATIKVQELREALGVVYSGIDQYVEMANMLSHIKIDDDTFRDIVKRVFPLDPMIENKPSHLLTRGESTRRTRAMKAWSTVHSIYKNANGTQDGLEGTAYGAWQAVIEYADHYSNRSVVKRAEHVITNKADRIKQKAFSTIVAYA